MGYLRGRRSIDEKIINYNTKIFQRQTYDNVSTSSIFPVSLCTLISRNPHQGLLRGPAAEGERVEGASVLQDVLREAPVQLQDQGQGQRVLS